jgi:hypothetical protein
MCLLAKIDNREFLAFYLPEPGSTDRVGRVELRDEEFHCLALDTASVVPIQVMDEDEPKPKWRTVSPLDLAHMARNKMHESLVGLRELYRAP